jgi:hypothetical protein
MEFNIGYCKVMHIGLHDNSPVHHEETNSPSDKRDIEVEVTDNLKPSPHCSKNSSKLFWPTVKGLPLQGPTIFIRLYKQYVRPHLETSSQAWSPWTETDREILEKVQK